MSILHDDDDEDGEAQKLLAIGICVVLFIVSAFKSLGQIHGWIFAESAVGQVQRVDETVDAGVGGRRGVKTVEVLEDIRGLL